MTATAYLVLALCALASGAFLRRPQLDGRIVGGEDAEIEDYPYQISLRVYAYALCGGSIISEYWVLTAALCVYNAPTDSILVRAGSNSYLSGGTEHRVARIIIHEKFFSDILDYNFALLQVYPPFTFRPGVQPVGLADNEPSAGENSIISGWGTTAVSGAPYARQLQVANVPIFDHSKCNDNYADYGPITARMICAGLDEGGKGTCGGDNGGPLVVGGKLVGVMSWSVSCAKPGYPSVYSSVANQRAWIKEKTGI